MKPKELQNKLKITADRIKFYKRQDLFFPENPPSGNRGTDYTESDYECLQFLEVLTKSGLTCSDIKKMQDGEKTLYEVAESRMNTIEADIERKKNALLMLSSIISDHAEFETFDTDYYWNIINKKEESGQEFINVEDMYGYQPVSLIRNIQCPYCHTLLEVDLEDYVYDYSNYEKENGMGPDCVYSFDSENCHICPKCEKTVCIKGWIREYPIGAYDSESISVELVEAEEED